MAGRTVPRRSFVTGRPCTKLLGMASKKSKSMSQEEILANFQKMRAEQQAIISKITELEGDKNEHR